MAVDTRDKRMSMLSLFQPVPTVLPNPDGTIGTQDRAMFRWLFHGLALGSPSVLDAAPIKHYILKAQSTVYIVKSPEGD